MILILHPSTNECGKNYIEVIYGKEANYTNGFGNDYRKGISFIAGNNVNLKGNFNETLIVKEGEAIKIYFSSDINSLENFFNSHMIQIQKKYLQ